MVACIGLVVVVVVVGFSRSVRRWGRNRTLVSVKCVSLAIGSCYGGLGKGGDDLESVKSMLKRATEGTTKSLS